MTARRPGSTRRSLALALLGVSALAATAGAMPPPADARSVACGVGRRAILADGREGRVVRAAAEGRCELALFAGGVAIAPADALRFVPAPSYDLDAAPPAGVYSCQPHGMGLDRSMSFALVDAAIWRNAAGERGGYRYDIARRELELVSGAWTGRRFRRDAGATFRILDAEGQPGATSCVLDPDRAIDAESW
jgi:hypothetical protein